MTTSATVPAPACTSADSLRTWANACADADYTVHYLQLPGGERYGVPGGAPLLEVSSQPDKKHIVFLDRNVSLRCPRNPIGPWILLTLISIAFAISFALNLRRQRPPVEASKIKPPSAGAGTTIPGPL
jgi:hypothetical protein